jgi:hypothetical protein
MVGAVICLVSDRVECSFQSSRATRHWKRIMVDIATNQDSGRPHTASGCEGRSGNKKKIPRRAIRSRRSRTLQMRHDGWLRTSRAVGIERFPSGKLKFVVWCND